MVRRKSRVRPPRGKEKCHISFEYGLKITPKRCKFTVKCLHLPNLSNNEVVWTFMKFKICLYFWGGFGHWRGSVASYTTDERAENGQKERWRLNVEELKLQIKSSSEKFRRLHRLFTSVSSKLCTKNKGKSALRILSVDGEVERGLKAQWNT